MQQVQPSDALEGGEGGAKGLGDEADDTKRADDVERPAHAETKPNQNKATMSGRGKGKSSKKAVTKSAKAGLQFPVRRVRRYLKTGKYATRIGSGEGGRDGLEMAKPTVDEVRACQFHSWYPKFGQKHAGRAATLEVAEDFVEYLKEDGITVPEDSRVFGRPTSASSSDSSSSETIAPDRSAEDDGERNQASSYGHRFCELMSDIDQAISNLNGTVVPKLNWTCPKDAIWINPHSSLRCENAEEVILMLKASDRVMNDVLRAYEGCSDPTPSQWEAAGLKCVLNLKKWYDFDRRREFRCFVVNGKLKGKASHCWLGALNLTDLSELTRPPLAGVCQRYVNEDASNFAANAGEETLEKVQEFISDVVKERLANMRSYALDIHISKKGRITVIDVNPCGEPTSALLFSWDEIFAAGTGASGGEEAEPILELRLVSAATSSITVSEKAVYGKPFDFVLGGSGAQ